MNRKLIRLSLYLNDSGLSKESFVVKKIAEENLTGLDRLLQMMDEDGGIFSATPQLNQEQAALLGKWEDLLSAINQSKTFNYEVTLSEISKAIGLEGDAIRSKGQIPEANTGSRMEALSFMKRATPSTNSENSANDQDLESLTKIDIDYDKIHSAINESVEKILNDLPIDQAEIIRSEIEREGLPKEAFVGKAIKTVGGAIGKALPVVGILISLPLFAKNLIEAYNNSVVIMEKLPLSKYDLSPVGVISPTFIVDGTFSHIESEIEKHSENPDNLMEILEIISVLKAFHLDMIFTITNGIALILDVISLILWAFPELISKVAAIIFSVADAIIQIIVLLGIELGSEYASEKYWSPLKDQMKEISERAISAIKDGQLSVA